MDARELVESWPGFSEMKPAEILVHPAWKLETDFDGDDAVLKLSAKAVDGEARELAIAITMDDEPHVLVLDDCTAFADLHLLWNRLGDLPESLIIALVEKEAGSLLQTVENIVRKELRIVKVADATDAAKPTCRFRLTAGETAIGFSLDLDADVVARIGVLDNLDLTHESVRSLTRPARAEYGVVELPESAIAALKAGDFLLNVDGNSATWQVELQDDAKVHIRGAAEESFSFAQFADDALPQVPPPKDAIVYSHGKAIAAATCTTLGDTSGFCLKKVY